MRVDVDEPPCVVCLSATPAHVHRALAESGLRVETDDLAHPRPGRTYLWWSPAGFDAAAARWVGWAAAIDPPAGLVAAVHSSADVERALAAGFDDAFLVDGSAREVAARLRAVHRRVHRRLSARPGQLRAGRFTLDVDTHTLWVGPEPVVLTMTELGVVRALLRARGRALSRADLRAVAWSGDPDEASSRAIDNVVLRLRRKIPAKCIETVRGVGFRLASD